jgi:hypothetical protein
MSTYPSKSDLVAKLVETSNAEFRVTNILILGKAETGKCQNADDGEE